MGNYLGRYGVYDGRHKDKYIRFMKRSERRSTVFTYVPGARVSRDNVADYFM